MAVTYQSIRARMLKDEKEYTAKVWSRYGRDALNDNYLAEDVLALCVKACEKVQNYVRKNGYNGYLNDTEKLRRGWYQGFISTGKTFKTRLYTVAALKRIYDSNMRWSELVVLAGAEYSTEAQARWAEEWDWLSYYGQETAKERAQRERAERQRKQREEEAERARQWSNRQGSQRSQGSQDRSNYWQNAYSQTAVRQDDWAYRTESAISQNETWFGILKVTQDATIDQIKSAYKKMAQETHPDAGGSTILFQAVVAAYRVAKLVKRF